MAVIAEKAMIGIVAVLYAWAAAFSLYSGDRGGALMYFGFVVANIGMMFR